MSFRKKYLYIFFADREAYIVEKILMCLNNLSL